MMRIKNISVLVITLMLCSIPMAIADGSDGAGRSGSVLIDSGNGTTVWADVSYSDDDTIADVIGNAAKYNGLTFSSFDGNITVNGLSESTVGGGACNPSFTESGTSSTSVTCIWRLYIWEESGWIEQNTSGLSSRYTGDSIAIGFYPADCIPTDTPDNRNSWVMFQGDSSQSGNQTAEYSSKNDAAVAWLGSLNKVGSYSSILTAGGYVFVKYCAVLDKEGSFATLCCYDAKTGGDPIWSFSYKGMTNFESGTPLIVSGYIYLQSAYGLIYKIPIEIEDGTDIYDVTTSFDGKEYKKITERDAIPTSTGTTVVGENFNCGPGSLTYDSGCIYCNCSNGMVYCFDLDLELIWSQQTDGSYRYNSPVIAGDYALIGAMNGYLYILNKYTGDMIASECVYQIDYHGRAYGSVSTIHAFETAGNYNIIVTFNDGKGMNASSGGVAVYRFNDSRLTEVFYDMKTFGIVGNASAAVDTDSKKGVLFDSGTGLYFIDTKGKYTLLNDSLYESHAPFTIVNDKYVYYSSYSAGKPSYILDLEGNVLSYFDQPGEARNYGMSPILVTGDYVYIANDGGMYCIYGVFTEFIPPAEKEMPLYMILALIVTAILVILAAVYCVMRFAMKIDKPFKHIGDRFRHYIFGEDITHNTKARRRLKIVLLIGTACSLLMLIACLCIGPGGIMSVPDMFSNLISAIGKGGQNLTSDEISIFSSRLPRTLAALAVGIGLSIAGAMYQAIIRNPMVDPYIMGVSAGAGTAAIAVIAFDFTFFGLFSAGSVYLVAITAMIGGVIAFGLTLLLAEKAGGSSVNYVLAGVIVGLAFSAIQTLMLSMSGEHLTDSISWLFGSFANINWTQVGLIVIPAITMSLIPLIWAKEFNLVLLGEDQARQMGLNVVRFNRIMLILASVLTSICVAFCGIIGFVGLVIPHLCRMILGGDHRLVLPASIAFGGLLMMGADLLSRMMIYGQELPVGAITTIIGVPVFAYLLIKRGRMYNG